MINISVVIPTRNRAALLTKTLDSVLSQDLHQDKFEVIVVDNGSSDDTPAVCSRYKDKFVNFQYFYEPEPGLHVGRNRGMLSSHSDILVYADDDIKASATWLSSILKGFQDRDTVLIGGSDLPDFENTPPAWLAGLWENLDANTKLLAAYSVIDMGDSAREVSPYYVFGCNFSIRKDILIKAGGFHPDGMPDNLLKFRGDGETAVSEYIIRNGLKTMFFPEASVLHLVSAARMSYDYVGKISYRCGISNAYTKLRREGRISFKEQLKLKLRQLRLMLDVRIPPLKRLQEKEWLRGYLFLIQTASSDNSVMDWIKKERYY